MRRIPLIAAPPLRPLNDCDYGLNSLMSSVAMITLNDRWTRPDGTVTGWPHIAPDDLSCQLAYHAATTLSPLIVRGFFFPYYDSVPLLLCKVRVYYNYICLSSCSINDLVIKTFVILCISICSVSIADVIVYDRLCQCHMNANSANRLRTSTRHRNS